MPGPSSSCAAQEEKPLLIIYSEPNFMGESLMLTEGLLDLPKGLDTTGNDFDWNDRIRSIRVVSGTWRLHQHGRFNTELDDTPAEALDIKVRKSLAGWHCLVSASSVGPLELSSPELGGWGEDISSIQLVSESNLPDWAI